MIDFCFCDETVDSFVWDLQMLTFCRSKSVWIKTETDVRQPSEKMCQCPDSKWIAITGKVNCDSIILCQSTKIKIWETKEFWTLFFTEKLIECRSMECMTMRENISIDGFENKCRLFKKQIH